MLRRASTSHMAPTSTGTKGTPSRATLEAAFLFACLEPGAASVRTAAHRNATCRTAVHNGSHANARIPTYSHHATSGRHPNHPNGNATSAVAVTSPNPNIPGRASASANWAAVQAAHPQNAAISGAHRRSAAANAISQHHCTAKPPPAQRRGTRRYLRSLTASIIPHSKLGRHTSAFIRLI